jgi:hypothetical protein
MFFGDGHMENSIQRLSLSGATGSAFWPEARSFVAPTGAGSAAGSTPPPSTSPSVQPNDFYG